MVLILCMLGMLIIGIALTIFGYKKLAILGKLRKEGVKTIGEIESVINPETTTWASPAYVPVVKFKSNDEVIIEVPKNSIRSNPTFYKIGEQYSIFYNADNPTYFAIEKRTESACAWAIICGGCFFIIVACITTYKDLLSL